MTQKRHRRTPKKIPRGLSLIGTGIRAYNAFQNAKTVVNRYKRKTKHRHKRRRLGSRNTENSTSHRDYDDAIQQGESHSCTILKYRPMKLLKGMSKLYNNAVYDVITSGFGSQTQGLQKAETPSSMNYYVGSAINTLEAEAAKFYNATTATYVQASVGNNIASTKFHLKSAYIDLQFANAGEEIVHLDIYDLVSKVTKVNYSQPENDWQNGLNDTDNANVTSNTFVGAVPTSSKFFNITWKIVRRTPVSLGLGHIHNHKWIFKPNRIIDTEYAYQYNQIKGITACTMIVYSGRVASSVNTFADAAANVTTTQSKILYTSKIRYMSQMISAFPRAYYQNNGLPTGKANLYVINEDTGAPVDTMLANTYA